MNKENQNEKTEKSFNFSQATRKSDITVDTAWMKQHDELRADLGATFKFFTDSFTIVHHPTE
jgi:hypothetical protein